MSYYLIHAFDNLYRGSEDFKTIQIEECENDSAARHIARILSEELISSSDIIYNALVDDARDITYQEEEAHQDAGFGNFYPDEWTDHYEDNLTDLVNDDIAFAVYALPFAKDEDVYDLEKEAINDINAFTEKYDCELC